MNSDLYIVFNDTIMFVVSFLLMLFFYVYRQATFGFDEGSPSILDNKNVKGQTEVHRLRLQTAFKSLKKTNLI